MLLQVQRTSPFGSSVRCRHGRNGCDPWFSRTFGVGNPVPIAVTASAHMADERAGGQRHELRRARICTRRHHLLGPLLASYPPGSP